MDWYQRHNCTHAHCPNQCEKPQPTELANGTLICLKCWFDCGIEVEMIPCTPEICD